MFYLHLKANWTNSPTWTTNILNAIRLKISSSSGFEIDYNPESSVYKTEYS